MEYTYTISQFPNQIYSLDRLVQEISNSSITIALDYINGTAQGVSIFFKATLSAGEVTTLDSIIAAHTGEPLPQSEVANVKIVTEQPKYIESGTATQELFCAESLVVDISAGVGTTVKDFTWPFNIALKSGTLYVSEDMIGDEVCVKIAPNTLIGALTTPLNVGDTSINVSPTVIQNMKYGRYVGLYSTAHELGRVTSVGTSSLTFSPPSDVSANAGSYVSMCAKIIPYIYFGALEKIEIGKTITTADRIPANIKIRLEYKNNTGTAKKISLFIEYLY